VRVPEIALYNQGIVVLAALASLSLTG